MKILLQDYLVPKTFKQVAGLVKTDFYSDDFDMNNIMVNIKGIEDHISVINKNKLTMITVAKVVSFNELIIELDRYESNYEEFKDLGSQELYSKRLFIEKPIILNNKDIDLQTQKFFILGIKSYGRNAGKIANNDSRIHTFVASESFLENKLSIIDLEKIMSELQNKELFLKEVDDIIPVKVTRIYTRKLFKLCFVIENKTTGKAFTLNNISHEIEFLDNVKEKSIYIRSDKPKAKAINLNKYLKEI